MKFTCNVEIDESREEVIKLFDNPDSIQYLQDGFVSLECLSGTPRDEVAISRVTYKRVELLETSITRNLPEEFHGSYEVSCGKNTVYNYFEKLGDKTKWTAEVEYLETLGIMMRLMKTIMLGLFKKQPQKWMDQFKIFVESK